MPNYKLFAIGLALAASLPALAAPSHQMVETPATDEAAIRAELAAILADAYDVDGPGATVMVTKGGRPLYHAARGMADIGEKRRMVPTERYNLASITKTISAATVAMLAEEGKLSLDDPISKYANGFPAPVSGATIRQLLNHTSGLTDISKKPGWIRENRDRDFSSDETIALLAALPPKAEPGAEWEYNNSGYMLLGAIVEKATGKSWEDEMQRLIAKPLGLTSFLQSGVTMTGYDGPDASAKPLPPFEDKGVAGSAGGRVGTVADLAAFLRALHGGRLLSPAMYAEAIAKPRLSNGKEARYGFGFRIGQMYGQPTYYQGGAMQGTRTETFYVPGSDVVVAILANSDAPMSQPRSLAERMAAAAMGRPFPRFEEQPLDLAQARAMIGSYEVDGVKVQFFERDGRLWFAQAGASAQPVTYFGKRRFYFEKERGDWFEFVRGDHGRPALRFHDTAYEEPVMAKWTGSVEDDRIRVEAETLKSYVGRYEMETKVVVHIEMASDGNLRMRQDGKDEAMPLRALDGEKFAIDGTPMSLEFRIEGGKVAGLRMYRGARTLDGKRID